MIFRIGNVLRKSKAINTKLYIFDQSQPEYPKLNIKFYFKTKANTVAKHQKL